MANAPMLCLLIQPCTVKWLQLRCGCCVGSVRTAVAHATSQSCPSWPSIRGQVSEDNFFFWLTYCHVLMIEHGFSLAWILWWQLCWQQNLRYKWLWEENGCARKGDFLSHCPATFHCAGLVQTSTKLLQQTVTTCTQPAQWNSID